MIEQRIWPLSFQEAIFRPFFNKIPIRPWPIVKSSFTFDSSIGWLQNTAIKFVCCDMPEATRETIGFMGVMARWEREQIAKRTKEALAEKKRQGVKLGYHIPAVRRGLYRYWKEYKKQHKAIVKEQKKKARKNHHHHQSLLRPKEKISGLFHSLSF